jgi:endonuclease/exonuclease/phosphatase family metal-dependent hydrolase
MGESTFVVGNLHATGETDRRLATAEVIRAATFADGFAQPGEPVVLAGDFNASATDSEVFAELSGPDWDLTGATPAGVDHVLARGLAGDVFVWPIGRRTVAGRVLSDHSPVERRLT